MNDQNKADDLPFLDDLPFTPKPGLKPEQPAAPAAPALPDTTAPDAATVSDAAKPAARPPATTGDQRASAAAPAPPQAQASQSPHAPAPRPAQPQASHAPSAGPVASPPQGAPPAEPVQSPAGAAAPAAEPAHRLPEREADGKRAVIPPAVLAHRMQRYSIYLIVAAFLLVGANYDSLSLSAVLWFAAGLSAGFAILCAVAVVLLNAIAWNFDRLRDELRGGREVVDLRE